MLVDIKNKIANRVHSKGCNSTKNLIAFGGHLAKWVTQEANKK